MRRARLALYWLALYRRRRMLLALTIGMVAFETLIIVITRTIPPEEMFAGSLRQPPSAFPAFSGSSGAVSLASYRVWSAPAWSTRSGSRCS